MSADTMPTVTADVVAIRATRRRHDWRSRLHAVVVSVIHEPGSYGTNDCALFTARCIEAITGEDLSAPFRGTYNTRAGGLAALAAAGFADLGEFAAANFEEIHSSQARNGDLALIDDFTCGIFSGERLAVLTPTSYGTVEREKATRAFRIGG